MNVTQSTSPAPCSFRKGPGAKRGESEKLVWPAKNIGRFGMVEKNP